MTRSRWLASFVLVTSILSSSTAFAQPPAKPTHEATRDAGKHFQRGVALFNEADYAGALAEFKKAYELAPNPAVLYNIGQTHF
jgi:Tfp pilus assembly protein PilF